MTNETNEDQVAEARRIRIRELNDALRRGEPIEGSNQVLITQGVQAFGTHFVCAAADAVKHFEDFTSDNDPHGEHDFGSLEVDGQTVFWKIDYYDLDLLYHSPDKANPNVTCRVLTILLASEY